jgi:O-antigen/teichoic acid export membrane protein
MSFLRAGAIYAAANLVAAAVPFLLLPILTRVLGPDQYGQVVNFSLLVTVCMTLAGLNAHAALGVVWFKQPREKVPSFVGAALMLAMASTIAVAAFVAAVIWIWPNLSSGLTPVWAAMAGLTAGASVILQCRLVLWQSQGKATGSAVLQVAASIINVGLSLVAVLLLGWAGEGRNAGFFGSAMLVACIAIAQLQLSGEVKWTFQYEKVRFIFLFGLPLVFHILGGVLLATADRWIISIKLGASSLGVYGAAAQLGTAMALLADAFVKAYGPWLYARLAAKDMESKHVVIGAIYMAIPIFFLAAGMLWCALHLISDLLLGPQYRAAAHLFSWFMLGGAFSGIYVCTSVLFFFFSRTALLSAVTLSTAMLGTLFTWLLVTSFGVDGAAMGYALTQGLLAVFVSLVAIRSFDLPWGDGRKAFEIWFSRAFTKAAELSA